MTLRTAVRLPEKLLIRAKRKAAAEGRTLTSLIEEGLRRVVAKRQQQPARPEKPTLPPVSNAGGGLMPSINLTRFSEIQARTIWPMPNG